MGTSHSDRRNRRLMSGARRLQIKGVATIAFAITAALTAIWPDWIEVAFQVDPDHGNGSMEWAIVAVLGLFAVCAAMLTWRDYRSLAHR